MTSRSNALAVPPPTSTRPSLRKSAWVEVEFNDDEKQLLSVLERLAQPDGVVTESDTRLIPLIGLPSEQFFRARMRLVAAGLITLHVASHGPAFLRLETPGRKSSERWMMVIAPLECRHEIGEVLRCFRTGQARTLPAKTGAQTMSGSSSKRWQQKERNRTVALSRLGVHRAPANLAGSLRPPIKAVKES